MRHHLMSAANTIDFSIAQLFNRVTVEASLMWARHNNVANHLSDNSLERITGLSLFALAWLNYMDLAYVQRESGLRV
mgnify:CR=1 FL=1